MKKEFLILAGFVAIVTACSKSDSGEDKREPAPIEQKEATFNTIVEATFTDPTKNIKNIQVGDYIPYEVKITDEGKEENITYSLLFTGNETDKHQTKGLDFELYTDNEEGNKAKIVENYISFSKKEKHTFYVKPLLPGTFILPFKFQKIVDDKVVGKVLPINVNFNAVKITAYTTAGRFRWVWRGLEQFSDNERLYKFKIEDGNNAKDIYLSQPNVTQVYTAEYEENRLPERDFREGEEFIFAERRTKLYSDPEFRTRLIKEIRITQRPVNQDEYEIVYYNVNIENRD